MSRMPLRIRVTLAFAVAMALVLAALGVFLYLQTKAQLDDSVNDTLEQRAADVSTSAEASQNSDTIISRQALDPEDSFAQVLDEEGRVVFSTSQVGERAVLPP